LDFQTTLEIHDAEGKSATFSKKENVLFLQDNIIAYQDQAWGDGNILLNYQCDPGFPVDFYRLGHKTYILISLHDVKNRGDEGNFSMRWGIKDGFLKTDGFWETDICHTTQHMSIHVIFPNSRPPRKWFIVELNHQKIIDLGKETLSQLPDKRWVLSWEKNQPRLYEDYILKWEW
jgi:hypothetical protein